MKEFPPKLRAVTKEKMILNKLLFTFYIVIVYLHYYKGINKKVNMDYFFHDYCLDSIYGPQCIMSIVSHFNIT